MKVLTILGTRPEIIRLSRIMPKLDDLVDHRVLHTGQNFDERLNEIFFSDLGLRDPDYRVDSGVPLLSGKLGAIFSGVEDVLNDFKPDKVLILGDTNSGLAAVICERLGYPVYHMEAGNRCYDPAVPEEKNRRIIDSISTYNLPYTGLSRENLLREGVANNRIVVTGNPIKEVIDHYREYIGGSGVLHDMDLEPGKYIIVTAHRAENVDLEHRLHSIFKALTLLADGYKIVFSCHPRTAQKMEKFGVNGLHPNIIVCKPFGFFDFVKLESGCAFAITDSGTVQEEMCLLGIPAITIRDSTERPETVWCGSNIVTGVDVPSIMAAHNRIKTGISPWKPPAEYLAANVSDIVINTLLSRST